ncbi:Kelch repeat-containing protein [Cellulomonas composti]|uniref:Galactose oxidase n=1 Tax=Cellulomonas composti TaxID=266130 RepID=A0A511J8W0_9CELL|nr:hypothetical protein [Cellulomonas composti]GEL94437.1 hypothetical protein CCO02nite_10950 [Cellulomonas composti]
MTGRRTLAALGVAAVLVAVGGCSTEPSAPATEPATGAPAAPAWEQVAPGPLTPRVDASVAWLGDRFLVAGGRAERPCPPNADCAFDPDAVLTDAATYDPVTRTWAAAAPLPVPLFGAQTALVDGALYLLGTPAEQGAPVFLAYEPDDDAWRTLPAPATPGRLATDSHVLVEAGGSDEQGPADDEIFDPATSTWSALPDDPIGSSFDRQISVVAGSLVLSAKDLVDSPGGEDGPAFVRLASFDLGSGAWTTLPDSEILGWDPLVASGRMVWPDPGGADGGQVDPYDREYPYGGIYDPVDGTWYGLPAELEPRPGVTWPRLSTGSLVTSVGLLLDPVSMGTWVLPDAPWDVGDAPTFGASPQYLLTWGGDADLEPLGWVLRLDDVHGELGAVGD